MRKAAQIAPNTLIRMRKDEEVTLTVLGRICKVLECDFEDDITLIVGKNGAGNAF